LLLVGVHLDSIQNRELDLLAKAYTSLPLQLAASRIWLAEDTAAERKYWECEWGVTLATQIPRITH